MTDVFFGISAKDWAEILRNYGLLIASFFTVWIAHSGLKAWKKQKIWESNRELAHEMILCLFRLGQSVSVHRQVTLEGKPLDLANRVIGSPSEPDKALAKFAIEKITIGCDELDKLIDEMELNFASITILWDDENVAEAVVKVISLARDLRLCLEAIITILKSQGQETIPDVLKKEIISPVLADTKGSETWLANFLHEIAKVRERAEPYIGRPS